MDASTTQLLQLMLKAEGEKKMVSEDQDQEVCCEKMSCSIWPGSYTHEIVMIWPPKEDLHNDNTSWPANVDGEEIS